MNDVNRTIDIEDLPPKDEDQPEAGGQRTTGAKS